MTKRSSLARISMTIPGDLLKAADRLAQQLDRSRSWVLIEERVLAAEEVNRLDQILRPPCPGLRVTFFDRFEDYLECKTYDGIVR